VPLWRYQVRGRDVEPVLRKEFDVPDRVGTYDRISVLSDGIALEAEFRYTDSGGTRRQSRAQAIEAPIVRPWWPPSSDQPKGRSFRDG
jgi:hypothetical protein